MSNEELEFLAKTASKCNTIIEVGSYQGRSARAMADNMKTGKLYCVDPWNTLNYNTQNQVMYETNDVTRNIFYMNLMDHIKSGRVIMCPKAFHEWIFENRPDFIFIDADHRYESVKRDIRHALQFRPLIIGGHDYCPEWPGVVSAVEEIFGNVEVVGSIWWKFL